LLKTRHGLAVTVMLLLAILGSSSLVQAAAPYTSLGSATVDGNAAEWNLAADFFADMFRAGKDDVHHPIESKVYLRYDPATQIMYVLVLAEPGVPALVRPSDAWVKIDSIGKVVSGFSINDAIQPNFAWVGRGYDGKSWHARGFEASFLLPRGEYTVHIHLQVYDDCESQTSRTLKAGLDLFVVPEYELAGLAALFSCFGAFILFKKRSSLTLSKQ